MAIIALVLLTEAHVAVSVSLSHAAVVHHEEVDLQLVGAGPPDVVVLRPDEMNHLDTATFTWLGGGHRALKCTRSSNKHQSQDFISNSLL